ncbi:MFS transporter [Paraburkholderia unamae]|uniref:MFS transporter n=1 Tax=Paraburkholderia unamae TaxID=219649 RepID=UPI000DD491A8|nr:MFS transporter [Paraburkholderia unamae]
MSTTSDAALLSGPAHYSNLDHREVGRVVLSGYLGCAIEFYDFLLYSTAAALVFGPVFFGNLTPLMATIAAYATFAAGYVARPLGGIVFGHFGDRLGRKRMLVITMTMMGIASTLVGLLPTPHTIGLLAPALLLILRVVQGIAVGGEYGGALMMAVEHCDQKRRGFYASLIAIGAPTGTVLASLAFGIVRLLPDNQFLQWGWRVPFLLSALLLVIGLYIRKRVSESPLFLEALKHEGEISRFPLVQLLRYEWKAVILAVVTAAGPLAIFIVGATFTQTYIRRLGFDSSVALFALAIANGVNLVWFPICAHLSDKYGRRPLLLVGFLLSIMLVGPNFVLVSKGNPYLTMFAFWLLGSFAAGPIYGALGAFLSEKFSTRTRYTGASIGYQLGSTLGAGLTPLIVTSIFASSGGTSVVGVIVFLIAFCLISMLCVLISKETREADISY